jgi:hypothetical protein
MYRYALLQLVATLELGRSDHDTWLISSVSPLRVNYTTRNLDARTIIERETGIGESSVQWPQLVATKFLLRSSPDGSPASSSSVRVLARTTREETGVERRAPMSHMHRNVDSQAAWTYFLQFLGHTSSVFAARISPAVSTAGLWSTSSTNA